jgi:guanylate cyclase
VIKALVHAWVWSGIESSNTDNINPIRMTNIIALLVILVAMCRLLRVSLFWHSNSRYEILLVVGSMLFMLLVPLINAQKAYQTAKVLLILSYSLIIVCSCLLWPINLNIQYYLLLAALICPFFFKPGEVKLMILMLVLLNLGFISLEIWFTLVSPLVASSLALQKFKLVSTLLFMLSCLLCSLYLWRNVNHSWQKLDAERLRSEQLLLNILPSSIAARLKQSPNLIADYFPQASILFADIQDFTALCRTMTPKQVIQLLNRIFSTFDQLIDKHGLEKIKTSGDGYMAAAGLPKANSTHATQCCYCALEMQQAFKTISGQYHLHTGLRIGIGGGEVIAGIIGQNKVSYDIWGEAVNLASRMESQGQSNKIQTTQTIYELSKQSFEFSKRGGIVVKGIGKVQTYWLLGKNNRLENYVPTEDI